MNRSDESKKLDPDKMSGVGVRQDSPRRRFLQSTIAGTVLGMAANLGVNLFSPEDAFARVPSLPMPHCRNSWRATSVSPADA